MPANTNKLLPNEVLRVNERLISNNQQFTLTLQPDGNLVLRDNAKIAVPGGPPDPSWMWDADGAAGTNPGFLALQGDGNLHMYDAFGNPMVRGNGEAFGTMTVYPNWRGTMLVLQDDGNLILFGITTLFQTATTRGLRPSPRPNPAPAPAQSNPVPAGGNDALLNGIKTGVQAAEIGIDVVNVIASLF